MMGERWITVIDVARAMRIEMSNEMAWSAGNMVRSSWEREKGELPRKALRPKTSGGGSHCFAIYPAAWRPRIEAVLLSLEAGRAAQGGLFDGEGDE